MKVNGSTPFSVMSDSFAISASKDAYTLTYSADGKTYTPYETEVPSGTTAIVNFAVNGLKYQLSGNTDTVYIQY